MRGRVGDGEGLEREESKKIARFLAWVTMWVEVPFTDEGYTRKKARL